MTMKTTMTLKKTGLFLVFISTTFIASCGVQKPPFLDWDIQNQPVSNDPSKTEDTQKDPNEGSTTNAETNTSSNGDTNNQNGQNDQNGQNGQNDQNNTDDQKPNGASEPKDDAGNSENTQDDEKTQNEKEQNENTQDETPSSNSTDNSTDATWRIQNPNLPSGKFIFNLTGFDDKAGTESQPSKIAFTFGVGWQSGSRSTEDGSIKNGKNIFGSISKDGLFRFYTFGNPANPIAFGKPQNCTIDYPIDSSFKTSKGGDLVVNMVCTTPAQLVALGATSVVNELEFLPNATYKVVDTGLKLASSDRNIISDKFLYESSNPEIATINSEGIIKLKQAGDFNISVKANPDFYTNSQTIIYKYRSAVNKSGIFIQDLHIGQSSVLPTTSAFHQLVANKETIIRGFVYSNKNGQTMPNANLVFRRTNGETFIKQMTCPANLKKGEYSFPDYNLAGSCYAIMEDAAEQKFIEEGVQISMQVFAQDSTITKTIVPKVAKRAILNIYLVKGKIARRNSQGALFEGYEAEVSKEDEERIKSFLLATFPISEVNIRMRPEVLELNANLYGALDQMKGIQDNETKNGEFAYALVPEFHALGKGGELNGLASGLSLVGTGPSVGRNKKAVNLGSNPDGYIKILAHELGHAFGLYHAPCGPGNNVEQVVDSFWRTNPPAWLNSNKGILSDSPLYVPQENKIINAPATASGNRNTYVSAPADLMGYCDGFRLSKHNYQFVSEKISLHKQFKKSSTTNIQNRSSATSGNKIVIRGKVEENANSSEAEQNPQSKILLEPIRIVTNDIEQTRGKDFGYLALITTEQGVQYYPLNFVQIDHSNSLEFELILPDLGKINKLEFMQEDDFIDYSIKGLSKAEQAKLEFKDFKSQWNQAGSESLGAQTNSKSPIKYNPATGIISWDYKKYKFMSAVFHTFEDKLLLVTDAEGGDYKIQSNLARQKRGFLQISLSDGINTYTESFFSLFN